MKKAGIAAVTYKDNFGSILQTYATQRTLEGLGYRAEIFNIDGVHRQINRKKVAFYLRRLLEPDEFKYLMDNLVSRLRKKAGVASDKYAENMRIRAKCYADFKQKHLHIMPRVDSFAGLTGQSRVCDCVVVGSDQLWRPSNIVGGYYTLDFVPDDVLKIACSTSFGVSELPKFLHKRARAFLNRMDAISVRENSGAKLVKELTGRDIPVVCDPTMLLDAAAWRDIQSEKPFAEGDYILCYLMGDDPAHRDFVRALRDATGCRIVGLLHGSTYIAADEGFADEEPYDVGPAEFVNLVRHAAYVCTDSFHCAVFSILHSRRFFAFRRYADESRFSTNDRLHTLLSWTELSDRLLKGDENAAEMAQRDIDYGAVLDRVADKRRDSMKYLTDALNMKENGNQTRLP